MKMWDEFKAFAFKGNMIDLAIAVVIGGAFGKVIDSLVKNIFMPLISYIAPSKEGYEGWHIGEVKIGLFLGDVVSFLIVALAVFIAMVKVLNMLMKKPAPPPPNTKDCPKCLMAIPLAATKCGHCTSDLL